MDSTSYVAVLEANNQILQHQNNILLGFMSILIAIFVILLGISWYWNTTYIRRKLTAELDKKFESYKETQSADLLESINEESKKISDTLDSRTLFDRAELYRLFGLAAEDAGQIGPAIQHISTAVSLYYQCGNDKLLRICVNVLLDLVRRESDDWDLNDSELNAILSTVNNIPDILSIEKEEIVSLLEQSRT